MQNHLIELFIDKITINDKKVCIDFFWEKVKEIITFMGNNKNIKTYNYLKQQLTYHMNFWF